MLIRGKLFSKKIYATCQQRFSLFDDNLIPCQIILNCAKFQKSLLTLEAAKSRLFDVTMIHRKPIIHYLLILCIAMAPVLTADVTAAGHMTCMSADYSDCGMNSSADHGDCDNTLCMSSSGICGTHASGYIPALSWMPTPLLPFAENHPSSSSRFRSRLVSSIYRPPIA